MPTSTTSGGIVTFGTPGREAEQQPAEHEQDRVRDPQRPGQDQQRGGRDEQHEELELLLASPNSRITATPYALRRVRPQAPPVEAFSTAASRE